MKFIQWFVVATVSVMVWLLPSTASATIFDCHIEGKQGPPLAKQDHTWLWSDANLDITIDAARLPDDDHKKEHGEYAAAMAYAHAQWRTSYKRPTNSIYWIPGSSWCHPQKKMRTSNWTCRIASRWIAVFGSHEKPVLKRGIEPATIDTFGDGIPEALRNAAGQHSNELRRTTLKGGRSITITFAAGTCWTSQKPRTAPGNWPHGVPW